MADEEKIMRVGQGNLSGGGKIPSGFIRMLEMWVGK